MISRQEAIELFETQDLLDVAMEADAVRKRLHPEGIVTYFIDDERNALPDNVARVTFRTGDTIEQHVDRLQTIACLSGEHCARADFVCNGSQALPNRSPLRRR